MTLKSALPLLALTLSACASAPRPQPIPVLAEAHQCPAFPLPPAAAAQAAGEDRLPQSDRLTATEQAIQLDELIKWVRAQAEVDNNPAAVASPAGD